MPRSPARLDAVLKRLARQHGAPAAPIPKTPFEWLLWENVAYLVEDARRAECFAKLRKSVGTRAEAVAAARPQSLLACTAGMQPARSAERLRECAELALELGGGDLRQLLELPVAKALRALQRFPGIGAPGAARILMQCGCALGLALESNGLRVLVRLGFGRAEPAYAKTYRSVQQALEGELESEAAWLARAHALLRAHGQSVCKSNAPRCGECSLADLCPSAAGFA